MIKTEKTKQIFTPNSANAFAKGYQKICDVEKAFEVKFAVMKILKITSDAAWNRRLNGCHYLTWEQKEAIQAVFAKAGIDDPWGL